MRINYSKQIGLSRPLSFECFHCSHKNSFFIFVFVVSAAGVVPLGGLKSSPMHCP